MTPVARGGSSPLTRGALVPAMLSSGILVDHPRSRGVHSAAAPVAAGERRIIPAHAGCTPTSTTRYRPTPDHPRSRGVHRFGMVRSTLEDGSSPLTRGARTVSYRAGTRIRIIPAHAGCTTTATTTTRSSSDHPRSRGVHSPPTTSPTTPSGSSPLTRGARGWPSGHGRRCWDHPRSRGVHPPDSHEGGAVSGSSPLTRGALIAFVLPVALGRIIPAHAGCT